MLEIVDEVPRQLAGTKQRVPISAIDDRALKTTPSILLHGRPDPVLIDARRHQMKSVPERDGLDYSLGHLQSSTCHTL